MLIPGKYLPFPIKTSPFTAVVIHKMTPFEFELSYHILIRHTDIKSFKWLSHYRPYLTSSASLSTKASPLSLTVGSSFASVVAVYMPARRSLFFFRSSFVSSDSQKAIEE